MTLFFLGRRTSLTICLLAQPQVQWPRASGRTRPTSIKKADALLYLEQPNKSRISGYSDATRLSNGCPTVSEVTGPILRL